MKKKILVALQGFSEYSEAPMRILKESGAEIVMNTLKHRLVREEIVQLGHTCHGIIAGVELYDKAVLEKLPNLSCISRCGVGIDNINLDEAEKRGVTVKNTPTVVIQPVAEMTVAMIFSLLRLLAFHTRNIQNGIWEKKAGHLLCGRKVGVIGLGRIGKKTAEILIALQADVYGCDLKPDLVWAEKNNIRIVPQSDLLAAVDVVCLHVSVMKDNSFYFGRDEIAQLKDGTLLINTSRGQILDEEALCEALRSGRLGGAGLDVFHKEPYAGPLKKLDNVVLTPHVSTLTEESRTGMEKEAARNIVEFFGLPS